MAKGVTVEELNIRITAQYKDAVDGLKKVENELGRVASQVSATMNRKLHSASGGMAKPMQQTALQAQKTANAMAREKAKLQAQLEVIRTKTQAQIETAMLREEAARIKAQQAIERQAQSEQKRLDAEKAAAEKIIQDQKDIEAAVARANERLQEQFRSSGTADAVSSAAAPSGRAAAPAATKAAAGNTAADEQHIQRLNRMQQAAAQYYAVLDRVKEVLYKLGLYGKESTGKLDKGMQNVRTKTEQASKSVRKFQQETQTATTKAASAFKKLGAAITKALPFLAVYQALKKIAGFIGDGIKSAIEAPEIENLFRTALGGMADEAAGFADQMKRSLGVDQYDTKQMLGTFQNLETSMGIGEQTAYKMSKSLTVLANDMASLYNVPVDQTFENLQSALTGQSEAVRKYGYVTSEAAIQQTALKYGLVQSGQAMTENQKVLARYLTLMEQSGNAQGDMARTIGSLQNQLRILQGNIAAAGRAIGEAFIPFIEAVVPWLNTLFVILQRVGQAFAKFTYSLFGKDYSAEKKQQQQIASGAGNIASGLGNAAKKEEELGDAAKKTEKKLQKSLAPFDELNVIQQEMAETADDLADKSDADIGTGMGALEFDVPELSVPEMENPAEKMADAFFAKLQEIADALKSFWDQYFAQPFADAWEKIKPKLDDLKETFVKIFEDIKTLAQPLKDWFFNDAIPMVQQLIESAGVIVSNFLDSANMVIGGLWEALFPMIEAFVTKGLPVITQFATEAIKTFETLHTEIKRIFDTVWIGVVQPALNLISKIYQDLMTIIKNLWDKWGATTFENIRTTIQTTADLFLQIWEVWVKPIFDQLFETLTSLWEEHLAPLIEKIGEFALSFVNAAMTIYNEFIAPLVSQFVDTLGPICVEIVNTIIKVVGEFVAYLIEKASNTIDVLQGIVDFLKAVFTKDWDGAWAAIKKIFTSVWDGMKSKASGTVKIIKTLVDGLVATIKKAISKLKELLSLGGGGEDTVSSSASIGTYTTGRVVGYQVKSNYGREIPQLASGAVLRRPTLNIAGEYPGASGNPEIVTPQSLMREVFVESLFPLVSAFHDDILYLAQVIQDNGVEISPEAEGIFNLVRKQAQNYKKRTNMPAFG